MSRVVVAGGDREGHVLAGLAVARELQAKGIAVHWLGFADGIEAEMVSQRGIGIELLDLGPNPRPGGRQEARIWHRLPQAILAAARYLLGQRPTAVLAVGGTASAVSLVAAGLLGVPGVLQEQNSGPDRVSRLLAPWSDLICCGFADAVASFPSLPAEWTGNPIRQDLFDIPDVRSHEPPQLLILAGRSGALFLNRILPRAIWHLHQQGISVVVDHQAGRRWADVVRTSYQDLGIEATVHTHLEQPWTVLAHADLVVARSSALAVSELAAAGRGAVLVPLGTDRRQHANARAVERAGGAVVIEEEEATSRHIATTLSSLLASEDRIASMGRQMRASAIPDAALRIADRLLAVGGAA
jgi:UDP-N-acetylglucosamine--N-acetylmuramyl-(pentapeptide) pyrophosphoryl-undecaprenol N-acetylglucosamine transferase